MSLIDQGNKFYVSKCSGGKDKVCGQCRRFFKCKIHGEKDNEEDCWDEQRELLEKFKAPEKAIKDKSMMNDIGEKAAPYVPTGSFSLEAFKKGTIFIYGLPIGLTGTYLKEKYFPHFQFWS